jgi:signal transduction histidine kinase
MHSVSHADDLLGGMWAVVATVFVYRYTYGQDLAAALSRTAATSISFARRLAYLLVRPFHARGLAALSGVGAHASQQPIPRGRRRRSWNRRRSRVRVDRAQTPRVSAREEANPDRILMAYSDTLSLMGRHDVVSGGTKDTGAIGRDVTHRGRADAELRESRWTAEASRDEPARLAEEHAALRRVATLVAHGAPPEALFTAVVAEVERVVPGAHATLMRYASDATMTIVAISERLTDSFPVGSRWPLGGKNVTTMVFETGRSARIDDYRGASGRLGVAVRDRGAVTVVGAPIVVEGRRWGVITLASTEHPLPPDNEAQLASFTELVATAIANAEAQRELAASRARIVAATDDERRRMVRDLHDGAQQGLVHTVITLKMARRALENGQDDTPALLTEALENAVRATDELRDFAHGILPDALTRGGLLAGVETLASRMPMPVEIDVSVGRLPATVEATGYFLVSEALTNVAKHARAGHAEVTAGIEDGTLVVHVRDDGIGGARPDGRGLVGLADRLAALDGQLRVESPTDGGTLVTAAIPIGDSSPEWPS